MFNFQSIECKNPSNTTGEVNKNREWIFTCHRYNLPLGKLFIPGKARCKDYGHVNENKEAKCLVTTKKMFIEMGLEMKHFSSLAIPLASLQLTYKVFSKVHPTERTEIEDTRTVLGQTKGQYSLITCLLHYLTVTKCAIPEQNQLWNSQPEQRHVKNSSCCLCYCEQRPKMDTKGKDKNKVVLHPVCVRRACSKTFKVTSCG